ncbi:nitrite reductase [Nocardioides lianchengensis]|uniref:nitrite reductase n=1 Tax=Nocardioides lianchengensis TaxID=1045774 RepID=UPI000B8A1100|nr:nitrite reductase [Nocardioides lianchengensis]NYG09363.1 precorrin-3B synthase [Nocardioides lianchengensis]
MPGSSGGSPRTRRDRCPGVLRPWPAEDGALVRLRLVGGRVSPASLSALGEVARRYGDGDVHLTGRANLQLRGLPSGPDGALPAEVVEAVEATGLLPSRTHELARNLMVSPQTGLAGGRANLRPVATDLDERLRAAPDLAALPGRFLFVLDDGRGDLLDRTADLGLVALSARLAQLRVGSRRWGDVVPLTKAAQFLVVLAQRFLVAAGTGPDAPWHVDELALPLSEPFPLGGEAPAPSGPLPHGPVPGGLHVAAPDGVLDPDLVTRLASYERELVVTPWRGVLVPDPEETR